MKPWEILADHLRTLTSDVTVYETPTDQMDAPCYVVIPGEPWIDPTPAEGRPMSSGDEERYEVWAIAHGLLAWASVPLIHSMLHTVRHNLPEGWLFESIGQFQTVEHGKATYFGAPVRVPYNNCDSGDESS